MKNKWIALILCITTGIVGGHHYYLGNWKKGIIYTLTAGGLIVGFIYDFFCILLNPNYINEYENKIINDKKYNDKLKEIDKSNKEMRAEQVRQINESKRARHISGEVCCPSCGSTQLTANKKGFSLGKAVAGGIILAPVAGVATGMIGKNKIIITCLNCGKQFKPGK